MKSTKELREFLVTQMEGVVNDEVSAEKAKSVGNLAQQIYNTINIEVKLAMARKKLDGEEILPVSFD